MQSNFDISEIGNQQHLMDISNSCSPVLPIFNHQKQNHHHHHFNQQLEQPEPYHISQLVHPTPVTHDLFQRQHLQAFQQQGRLHWQLGPVNFKLGLNENSGNGESALLGAGLFDDENGDDPRLLQSRAHNLGFKSWQTHEPMCWKPLDAPIPETNRKQNEANEGDICKDLENKYRLYGELEAIYSLAKMGEANQTGSGSALTGENSPKNVDLPVLFCDPHDLNVAPTAQVRVDNGSEASIGEEASPRKIQKRKRKRTMKKQLSSVISFFESLVKQVMDHQENLHKKYLEVIERMDKERREREAAWRSQEAENHKREAIAKVHEQALASSREALIVSYIEKITGQRVNLPSRQAPLLLQPDNLNEPPVEELTPFKIDHTNSRWPQSEVEALILVRSSIESKFQEPGVKGPVWEEVSALMGSMGYQRSAKRCKQKWENINKYFRKTKDSAKKRPHNFKTCSYFNQLDQLYSGTPITAPSSSSSYYSSNPSASMDDNIPKQGFSDLLEAFVAGREAGVAHNLSSGNFQISEMGSNRLDFDGIIGSKVEDVQGDLGKEKENCEDDENVDETEDTEDDDSDE
ncbi:hypothetical protein ACE6H2_004103 [Prunus campanulata]